MKRLLIWLRSHWSWLCAVIVALAVMSSLVVLLWEWFATEPCGMESRSTTLRNVVLGFGAIIALFLAAWRGIVADRQAEASRDQAETSRVALLHDRFQRGAEMLGNPVLPVRLGGIYALHRLAADHAEQYHVQIMQLLCAFVRHPTKDEENMTRVPTVGDQITKTVRVDVQAAMQVIGGRGNTEIDLEKKANFFFDLMGADLSYAQLAGTNLTNAVLFRVNLTGTILAGAKGLTQAQLEIAYAEPGKPPQLGGLCDAVTGERLYWRDFGPKK